jgi:plastocyanin
MGHAVTHSWRSSIRAIALILLLAAPLLFAPNARADERIQARPSSQYTSNSVTIDQGERLTFQNVDITDHDVTASGKGPDGKPLFSTPLIGGGEEAFVEGSQYLTTGHYDFFCSIHANMTGTLHVSSAGTPVPRPGTPGAPAPARDATKPALNVKVKSAKVRRVRRARKLVLEVTVDEAAKVVMSVTTRIGRRTVTIARGTVDLSGAGKRLPELKLTRAGRRALRNRSRARLTVSASAIDKAGNASQLTTKRTLRR